MARAATTSDVFNAIAEARRRRILGLLAAEGEQAVSDLVHSLRLPQPVVSKHLGVLREVRLVVVTSRGRQRLYRLNAQALRPVYEWVRPYERFWSHQLSQIKARAEQRARSQRRGKAGPKQER